MRRMNITFNDKCYKALEKLSVMGEVSKGEILRNAIALLDYVEERKEQGYKLTLVKDGKMKQEIVMP